MFSVKTFVLSATVTNARNVKGITIFRKINVSNVQSALAHKTVLRNANVQGMGLVLQVNVTASKIILDYYAKTLPK